MISILKNHVQEQIKYLLKKSITNHCVSDVDIASYLSGGIDSSLIYTLSANENKDAFHGRFTNMMALMKVHMPKMSLINLKENCLKKI